MRILKQAVFVGGMVWAEGAQDAYIFINLLNFLLGNEQEEQENSPTHTITTVIMCLIAIPIVLAMLSAWQKKSASTNEENDLSNEGSETLMVGGHKHHHGIINGEVIKDSLTIGAPFGILAFSGLTRQLNNTHPAIKYTASTTGALIAAFGNYQLHTSHIHDEEGVTELSQQVSPSAARSLALIYLGFGVLVGHGMQGYLSGDLFTGSLPIDTATIAGKCLQYGVPLLLSALVAYFEGYTEMHSTLLEYIHGHEHTQRGRIAKISAAMSATVHAAIPTLGAIKFINFIKTLVGGKSLYKLPLAFRITLLGASGILLGIPNAKGFYSTTVEATDSIYKNIYKNTGSLFTYITRCMWRTPNTAPLLGDSIEDRRKSSLQEAADDPRSKLCCCNPFG